MPLMSHPVHHVQPTMLLVHQLQFSILIQTGLGCKLLPVSLQCTDGPNADTVLCYQIYSFAEATVWYNSNV